MFLEIFIYLTIAFGILILCITMLEQDYRIDEKYIVLKKDNTNVKVIIETKGLGEEDARRIGWIIRKGKYQDIYDIAHEYEMLTK